MPIKINQNTYYENRVIGKYDDRTAIVLASDECRLAHNCDIIIVDANEHRIQIAKEWFLKTYYECKENWEKFQPVTKNNVVYIKNATTTGFFTGAITKNPPLKYAIAFSQNRYRRIVLWKGQPRIFENYVDMEWLSRDQFSIIELKRSRLMENIFWKDFYDKPKDFDRMNAFGFRLKKVADI